MKYKYIICCLASCLLLVGCASKNTLELSEEEQKYVIEYVNFSNTYIEGQIEKHPVAARKFAEPYRTRYRIVKNILKIDK